MRLLTKTEKADPTEKKVDPVDLPPVAPPESEASPIILFNSLKEEDDAPRLRMLGLFGDLNEEKVTDLVQGFFALYQYGAENIYENPEDPDSPIKEVTYKPIEFNISTWGGCARGMFAVYDTMRSVREECEIITYGLGKVMSAGVLLLAAGTKGSRKIGKNCRVMIHSVRGDQFGAIHNLENEFEETKWLQEQHINSLVAETDMTKKHLKKLLDRKVNVYLTAKEAVEYGIADIIV
jgi:ATP-dependent Clp endopeptidase proteolytic subunit ClpP